MSKHVHSFLNWLAVANTPWFVVLAVIGAGAYFYGQVH